jgi:hypothetical protein
VDGRDKLEEAKTEHGWIPLQIIKENTSSELVEMALNGMTAIGLLESKTDKQGTRSFRISMLARRMGLSWKNLKLK